MSRTVIDELNCCARKAAVLGFFTSQKHGWRVSDSDEILAITAICAARHFYHPILETGRIEGLFRFNETPRFLCPPASRPAGFFFTSLPYVRGYERFTLL